VLKDYCSVDVRCCVLEDLKNLVFPDLLLTPRCVIITFPMLLCYFDGVGSCALEFILQYA
jgi:hypothetical protein